MVDTAQKPAIDLSGTAVVVTGGAGGLGRAFALGFAGAGAAVMVADINAEKAAATADLIDAAGGRVVHARVDVTDPASCGALVAATVEAFGRIDTLVNNAAIYAGLRRGPFEDIPEGEWDRVMAVNVKGVWEMVKAVSPVMRAARHGSIVNISSGTFFAGSPNWLHYVASKGAVVAMTRSLARELGTHDITVNAIAPGFTMTEASLSLVENAQEVEYARGAIKRPAEAQDIVGAALFLASAASRFFTGQTMLVDGGRDFH